MTNIFRKDVPLFEKRFRIAVVFWIVLFIIFAGSGVLGIIKENQLLLDFVVYPAVAFMALTPILFFLAVIRLVIKLLKKEHDLMFGYLIYAGLTGLFVLPMIFALYDKYKKFGDIW